MESQGSTITQQQTQYLPSQTPSILQAQILANNEKKFSSIVEHPRTSHSPAQQVQVKRKPPLPSPFLSKHDGSHSKLAIYSQAQVLNQHPSIQAFGQDNNKLLAYNQKSQHQISQNSIPPAQSQNGLNQQQEEEFRQTWGKMKPRISKQLPAPFNPINKTSKAKGQKAFSQFKQQQESEQTKNFYLDKLDSAVTAEEYKQMQNLLQPLQIEQERKDKMERALTKNDQYNTSNNNNPSQKLKKGFLGNLDPLPQQMDGLSKILQNPTDKQLLSQSSAFSTFDTYSLKALQASQENLKLEQMITLAVFKSTSGTVKKMLHAPSLRIFCIKEVPITNRDSRQMLKDWISKWEHNCVTEQFIKISGTFWNSPEGCVSVVTEYSGNGSLQNLLLSIGSIPESILKHLAKSILRSLDYLHDKGISHNNICCSQILFDRKGNIKIGPGFAHIVKSKTENQSTLHHNSHQHLTQLLCEGTDNYKIRQNLLKEKFQQFSNLNQQATDKKDQPQAIELKKLDLFDLGVLLIIAATGGLDVFSEESIASITNLSSSCCILHAVQGGGTKQGSLSKSMIVIRKILNRLSTQAQDFICKCLQQRFSANEIKHGKPAKLMTTSDMLTHQWILAENEHSKGVGIKANLSEKSQKFKLSLKELLNISIDWKDENKKNPSSSSSAIVAGGVPADFQSQQIEKIVEAIALTLPHNVYNDSQIGSGTLTSGGTIQDQNILSSNFRFDEQCIRELAYDLGVDPRSLKAKFYSTFINQSQQDANSQIDQISSMQFNI